MAGSFREVVRERSLGQDARRTDVRCPPGCPRAARPAMPAPPRDLTDPPDAPPEQRVRDGLRCLQLSGALFLRANFSAPWAYRSPESAMIAAKLRPGGRRVIV